MFKTTLSIQNPEDADIYLKNIKSIVDKANVDDNVRPLLYDQLNSSLIQMRDHLSRSSTHNFSANREILGYGYKITIKVGKKKSFFSKILELFGL